MLNLNNVKVGSFMHNFILQRQGGKAQPVESFANDDVKFPTGPEFEFDDL